MLNYSKLMMSWSVVFTKNRRSVNVGLCPSSSGKSHLRCFVLIDLKINEVQHQDIGQMNMYLGYFAQEENIEGDNPPIGIILSRNKDELLVEYATYQMNSQLFVQKYQLYLPNQEDLRRELEITLRAGGVRDDAEHLQCDL